MIQMSLRYLSVCSGIEAATQAWHPLGWSPVAFSEIEKFPSEVLAHHYPSVPNWGDMTKFQEWPDADVDVLAGGTPCQSFSVAGLRKGLADPRGNLMLTYLAIAAKYRPRWLVWENVPGVLSSNGGRDFAAFLGGLGELGYGFAYRVLDAQHVRTRRFPFAVPQRRRRVWVVGYLGDWRRAAAVLFDRESLSGHPAPRREAGQGIAKGIEFGPSGGGFTDVNPTLDTRAKDGPVRNQLAGAAFVPAVSMCLNAGAMGRIDGESETFIPVAHSLRGEGFDASEDGTGRGTPIVPVSIAMRGREDGAQMEIGDDCAFTLRAATGGGDKPHVFAPVAFVQNTRDEVRLMGGDGQIAGALAAEPGAKQQCYVAQPVAFDTTQITSKSNYSNPKPGDPCHPLAAGAHPPAVAFDCKGTEVQFTTDGSHPPPPAMGHSGSHQNGGGHAAVALPWAVRRLMPVECERLQGFPDNFTAIPWRGKSADQCPDGPRYKALGNSWAVNCAEYIGERIAMVDALTPSQHRWEAVTA